MKGFLGPYPFFICFLNPVELFIYLLTLSDLRLNLVSDFKTVHSFFIASPVGFIDFKDDLIFSDNGNPLPSLNVLRVIETALPDAVITLLKS